MQSKAAYVDDPDIQGKELLSPLHVACHSQPEWALYVLERTNTQLTILQRNGRTDCKAFVKYIKSSSVVEMHVVLPPGKEHRWNLNPGGIQLANS